MRQHDYASPFYRSQAWRKCRNAYAASVNYLCERCLKKGLIVPGVQVHHKVKLTQKNIKDPTITLDFRNLQMLCVECHQKEHEFYHRPYWVNEDGTVVERRRRGE